MNEIAARWPVKAVVQFFYNLKRGQGSNSRSKPVALALREDADERVEEAVEEMLNELWRKIDGYRN